MDTNRLGIILTGSWQDELKNLPKYQKKAIKLAATIYLQLDRLKFGIIDLKTLQIELRKILRQS